ncbi:endonuclease/exonuclease/phosphatase family protein [Anatilimnocola sp. NA78]|uniref:endonuclease/exonuclease/phosphatase family protein n=1 Tax=Anatilimnocola sp. NA78 TaxID=3415683 RepID=UPI003CE514B5
MLTQRTIIAAVVCCCVLLPSRVTAQQKEEQQPALQLRVLSYNIHHGEGVDGKLDLERIAKVILSVKPDLVALQEVDRKVKRSKEVDQPAELARLTEMKAAFGGNLALQGGEYGNAILSRFPIKADKNHLLPNLESGEQRGVLQAEIEVPKLASPLLFLATHFDHRRKDEERVDSAKFINGLLSKTGDREALLAGDLNDVHSSRAITELQTSWKLANETPQPTIPVEKPTRQIDFVLLRPAARWKVVDVKVLDEAVASDHRAILAVLEHSAAAMPPN